MKDDMEINIGITLKIYFNCNIIFILIALISPKDLMEALALNLQSLNYIYSFSSTKYDKLWERCKTSNLWNYKL